MIDAQDHTSRCALPPDLPGLITEVEERAREDAAQWVAEKGDSLTRDELFDETRRWRTERRHHPGNRWRYARARQSALVAAHCREFGTEDYRQRSDARQRGSER